jgi:chromosome segregation ATPase
MKSFFDEFFSVDGFGKMKLFDFPFDTDVKEDENDGENHTYFHKVTDKYDELGQRISHVEKEVKDGKVLKDIKEEPKLQAIDKPIDTHDCTTDELKKLKEDYSVLSDKYDELVKKLSNIEDMYNNVKKENDAFKLGLRNLLSLEK